MPSWNEITVTRPAILTMRKKSAGTRVRRKIRQTTSVCFSTVSRRLSDRWSDSFLEEINCMDWWNCLTNTVAALLCLLGWMVKAALQKLIGWYERCIYYRLLQRADLSKTRSVRIMYLYVRSESLTIRLLGSHLSRDVRRSLYRLGLDHCVASYGYCMQPVDKEH